MVYNKKEAVLKFNVIKLFLSFVQSGLFGFAIFFTVLLITKSLSTLIGHTEPFKVELSDVTLSLIGFVLTFLISFLTYLTKKEETEKSVGKKLRKRMY